MLGIWANCKEIRGGGDASKNRNDEVVNWVLLLCLPWHALCVAHSFDGVVGPGEMIFYPGRWWHATKTLDSPTVSLSALFVDRGSRSLVQRAIAEQCTPRPAPAAAAAAATGAPEFEVAGGAAAAAPPTHEVSDGAAEPPSGAANFPPALCKRLLGKCFPLLETLYGE